MAISSGSKFASYVVAESIGVGGMGEVFRARDTTLERDVAIKVLPESFAEDADRVARFDQEAKTLASLNHPNIGQIYGLEKVDGDTALVMELVEGPTLADRLEQGPIPTEEAFTIAMQITDALEAAHEQGIVHRDLKPANIKLRPDGIVKVLDFGIAKAMDVMGNSSGQQSPVLTTPAMTQSGLILGTAAYMSPEQARGKAIDRRTDIWAFGCVLYEMLTGQLAFGGEDVALTLARVLSHDTDMKSLPTNISPVMRHTIELCLEKDPKKRIADISDVRLALKGRFETGQPVDTAEVITQPLWLKALPVLTALIAGVAVFFAVQTEPESPLVNRFAYSVPADQEFRRPGRNVMALSPDGRHFVYNTDDGLYLRTMGELEARLIPGTEEDLANPFFSPDGQSVAYFSVSASALKRIAISGGAPVTITDTIEMPTGASWASDNMIYFGAGNDIYRVSGNGGTPERVIEAVDDEILSSPYLLPDSDLILFSASEVVREWDDAEIVAQSLASGERTVLVRGGADARYLPSGHLLYSLNSTVLAVAFDLDTLSVTGGAVPLFQQVSRASFAASANFGVSDQGTVVYLEGVEAEGNTPFQFVWIDANGQQEALGIADCLCADPALSPDGSRLALTMFTANGGNGDIWIWSFEQGTLTRLTFEPGRIDSAVWSPDGTSIAYSTTDGIYIRLANGTGNPEKIMDGTGQTETYSWTENGQIVFQQPGAESVDIGMVSVEDGTQVTQLLATEFSERRPALSPDQRWLAYESNESGEYEIYVRPFPDVDAGKWQVSSGGGQQPMWASDNGALFYMSGIKIMSVNVLDGDAFRNSPPVTVMESSSLFYTSFPWDFEVTNDGQRFITHITSGAIRNQEANIIVVQNWFEELNQLLPTN